MTVEHKDGYLPWGVGITRRPMRERFMEHTRSFKAGDYNILDIKSAYDGIRKVVWKGWGWTDEKRADYSSRTNEILLADARPIAIVPDKSALPSF